jgi:CheY-like chemotaxis protein
MTATPLRILVVDDSRDAAETLSMLLGLMGHDVRVAGDGAEGVRVAGDFRPQVALVDISMPVMDGYEAARRMRALPGGSEMRLYALSGWGDEDDKRRMREAGFDDHLLKPIDADVLLGKITGG